jgi:hypothetical protein
MTQQLKITGSSPTPFVEPVSKWALVGAAGAAALGLYLAWRAYAASRAE